VDIEEIFHHCAKAFPRSALGKPENWNSDVLPSRAQIAHTVERTDDSLEDPQRYYGPEYEKKLYG
jgi:hypothetical protein